MKETGILMPVFSLPSQWGLGEFGKEAVRWLDLLKENSISIWQILPLNPVGYGNSPYQPYSSYAGDELYIGLEKLYEEGLLSQLPPPFRQWERKVDYDQIRQWKEKWLKEAFQTFVRAGRDKEAEYLEFISQDWVELYGAFRAMKEDNGGTCWNEWPKEDRQWPKNRSPLSAERQETVNYHRFLQYIFYRQWTWVREKAREREIRIMGDMPFYVGVDSVDVWGGKDNFLLDTDGRPVFIAGVPPDYFSATGQRWGNPIYDWDYMKSQNYQFWVDRIGYSSRLFDIIRIDHFRAFDTFWKIPATCPTAIEGQWIEAPGYQVLDRLREALPQVNLVAEDLGELRPEVLQLKDHYGLKGMKVLVFSISWNRKYAYDNFGEKKNLIIYTGTHDNSPLKEWYEEQNTARRRKLRRFLKKKGIRQGSVKDRLIAYTLSSKAEYAILSMPDVLGLGKEGHINTPGTVGSPNWEWRMPDFCQAEKELKRYRSLIEKRKEKQD